MNSTSYIIEGGDYERGGSASRSLKEQLKQIGADPDAIRRAMIAAYEAEMNVVIHAYHGKLTATVAQGRVDVEVADEGPGIADIPLAMQEGYSTAPPRARELGFGAGLGLPNIRKNSDFFAIESTVGQGTRVSFGILLRPHAAKASAPNSLHIEPGKCKECFRCLRACPAKALRLRGGRPEVLAHLCLDCATCIASCPNGAMTMTGTIATLESMRGALLVVPPPLLVQMGPSVGPQQVMDILTTEMGFSEVCVTEPWEKALRQAVLDYAGHEAKVSPVISPACPAVVNIIEMRFPSLIGHLAPFAPPVVAAHDLFVGERAAFVALCPCQRTALEAVRSPAAEIIVPATLRSAALPLAMAHRHEHAPPHFKVPADYQLQDVLEVTGITHVMKILELTENGMMDDVAVLEPYLCEKGCFGSPLLWESPFAASHRWSEMAGKCDRHAQALRRRKPFEARRSMQLDKDMDKAMEKLSQIEEFTRTLPGKDCGLCGCPTCAAYAEDVVLGRVPAGGCKHQKGNP